MGGKLVRVEPWRPEEASFHDWRRADQPSGAAHRSRKLSTEKGTWLQGNIMTSQLGGEVKKAACVGWVHEGMGQSMGTDSECRQCVQENEW